MKVGETLADHLMKWFREKGAQSCELQVVWGNTRALDFWKHMGFEDELIQLRKRL
jgi:ribosomal protein S18 acetylase RimI-like enzyme